LLEEEAEEAEEADEEVDGEEEEESHGLRRAPGLASRPVLAPRALTRLRGFRWSPPLADFRAARRGWRHQRRKGLAASARQIKASARRCPPAPLARTPRRSVSLPLDRLRVARWLLLLRLPPRERDAGRWQLAPAALFCAGLPHRHALRSPQRRAPAVKPQRRKQEAEEEATVLEEEVHVHRSTSRASRSLALQLEQR
jgi:hypothetical protein